MTLPSLKQAVQAMYQTLCPALWEGDVLLQWAVSTSLLVLAAALIRLYDLNILRCTAPALESEELPA